MNSQQYRMSLDYFLNMLNRRVAEHSPPKKSTSKYLKSQTGLMENVRINAKTKDISPLSPKLRIYLFDSLIRPVLTYGSGVWGINKKGRVIITPWTPSGRTLRVALRPEVARIDSNELSLISSLSQQVHACKYVHLMSNFIKNHSIISLLTEMP